MLFFRLKVFSIVLHNYYCSFVDAARRNMTANEEKFRSVRPLVVRNDTIATLSGAAWMYFGYKYLPFLVPEVNGIADQLVYALRWQIPATALIMYLAYDTANERIKTGTIDPVDPALKKDPESLTARKNILQNTIEQMALHSPNMLVLATYLRQDQLKMIPLLSILFVVGRLWYRRGYLNTSSLRAGRSGGMWMTFIPTLAIIGYNLFRLFKPC